MKQTAANIYLPLYAVTERESPGWAYYYLILLDYVPLVLISLPTVLCTVLVGVAVRISGAGWENREHRISVGVFQVGCRTRGGWNEISVYTYRIN